MTNHYVAKHALCPKPREYVQAEIADNLVVLDGGGTAKLRGKRHLDHAPVVIKTQEAQTRFHANHTSTIAAAAQEQVAA